MNAQSRSMAGVRRAPISMSSHALEAPMLRRDDRNVDLEELYERCAAKIRGEAFFILKDAYLAEDVCHDVLLKASAAQECQSVEQW